MVAQLKPKTWPQREKLLYFLTLRQMEAPSVGVAAAYTRLAEAAMVASGWNLHTVILDWLETELRSLQQQSDRAETSADGRHLMRAAVALSNALKQ